MITAENCRFSVYLDNLYSYLHGYKWCVRGMDVSCT